MKQKNSETIVGNKWGTDCPDNWTAYATSCYLFGHQNLSFYSAEHYCRQHNGYLVHVLTDDENVFIREHLRYMIGNYWWIGLSDDDVEGTFVWYGTNQNVEYTDWSPGEPTNSGNREDCVNFVKGPDNYGHWNDVACDYHIPFICQRPHLDPGNGIVG